MGIALAFSLLVGRELAAAAEKPEPVFFWETLRALVTRHHSEWKAEGEEKEESSRIFFWKTPRGFLALTIHVYDSAKDARDKFGDLKNRAAILPVEGKLDSLGDEAYLFQSEGQARESGGCMILLRRSRFSVQISAPTLPVAAGLAHELDGLIRDTYCVIAQRR